MPYQILRRRDYDYASTDLPVAIRRKADWAIVQLAVRGRTPSTKGTIGHKLSWRRSPVQGSHYYLWWLNAGDSGIPLSGQSRHTPHTSPADGAILVHSIRHHDQTDQPIAVGSAGDYEALDVGLLDPRFDDQEEVALVAQESNVAFTVIEGMPGSGKSVALLFLARDLATRAGVRKVRYITYTERLKRAAREIFDALGPEIAEHITVHTVNDVVKQLVGKEVGSSPFSEIGAFVRDLEQVNPAQLGQWKNYPLTLYTELRAHVAGRTFPPGYQLPAHREEQMRRHGGLFDVERYARRRKLDTKAAEQSVNLAERLANRYFLDQQLAAAALEKLHKGESPAWLAHTDAFIIDEVQDFTLLQIALVAEMAAVRRKLQPERPLSLTIAGDESQIVQPTGFKWGVTKDLITERLDVHPRAYHFEAQRRSPPLLARLTQRSWELYARLPKDLRPSAAPASDGAPHDAAGATPAGGDSDNGLIVLTPPPTSFDNADWRALLAELAARPGRALIDLTERPTPSWLAGADPEHWMALNEIIFPAREIKGLERGTVLVLGLETIWQRVEALSSDDSGNRIPLLEARRLIDQMRVALSRSTSRLILLDEAQATIFGELGIVAGESALQLPLTELVELLQGEQMTDAEMVMALHEEAEDLAERGRIEDALRRNQRAASIAQQQTGGDLLRILALQEADLLARLAESELAAGRISAAQERHQQAAALFAAQGPQALQGERAERWQQLSDALYAAAHSEFAILVDRAENALAAGRWNEAAEAANSAYRLAFAGDGAHETPPAQLPAGPERSRAERAIDVSLRANSALADALSIHLQPADGERMAAALHEAAACYQLLGDGAAAALYTRLNERYRELPPPTAQTPDALRPLIALTSELLRLADPPPGASAGPAPAARHAAFAHTARWLDEAATALDGHVALFYPWATAAAHLARLHAYAAIDDRLWDLENRFQAAGAPPGPFAAFLAAYNGDAASASRIWEQLGELEMAVEAARAAGELERAHTLLRAAHRPIPEDLATAVKAQRYLQQLQQKHQTLRPGERRALAEELARLHVALTADDETD